MTGAQRVVDAAKAAHAGIAEAVLDLEDVQQKLAGLRRQLSYAVAMYDSGAVTELPDNRDGGDGGDGGDDGPHDPRD